MAEAHKTHTKFATSYLELAKSCGVVAIRDDEGTEYDISDLILRTMTEGKPVEMPQPVSFRYADDNGNVL